MMTPNNESAEFMDTHEVASYLRLKERKIYSLVREKSIPCVRVSGKWLFPRTAVDAWLAEKAGSAAVLRLRSPMIAAGSHDPLLEWCLRRLGGRIAGLPGTSRDGIARVAAGEAVFAGVHLLDGESGEYNVRQVNAALASQDVVLIEWAWREQGLIVPAGNPLSLRSLSDVVHRSARVALRQEGAGSRELFDWLLTKEGFRTQDLLVGQPALNEMEIGLAVLEGTADSGLAVGSVARSLKLDFVPLHRERFDLVIHRQAYFEPVLQDLFALARSREARVKAEALGGYDLSHHGAVRWNAP